MLGAEFLASTGSNLEAFGNVNRLAAFAGPAPAPRDCGRVSGNMRRPRRYHRGLLRTSAFRPWPASDHVLTRRRTTSASAAKARTTCRPYSPWPAYEPTSRGP
ncbi:transposase [Streptomyces sp. NPDC059680]|uniref:transposase n=1 Tax=Streptomyces sp. NPDC059680 TaxID=3346904 RepID=UPI0036C3A2C6